MASEQDVPYNTDKVREAFNAREAKRRQAAYERLRAQRALDPNLPVPVSVDGPSYRYVKEVWNTHLIVKGEGNELFKVPYTVQNGTLFKFGKEIPVTEQYVELSHADEADLLAEFDDAGNQIGLLVDLADSEHVPSKGGKNWVTKTGGLPEYINRIAKDLMDKGMAESHAIATAVNTVKKWAAGGKDVKPQTRAKAAAALAEWESKKARAHANLSHPSGQTSGQHDRLRTVDLSAVLQRAAQVDDPRARAQVRLKVLDLAIAKPPVKAGGAAVASGRSYSLDELATRRAKILARQAAKSKKDGSRKTKKAAGKKSKYVRPPKRVKPITAQQVASGTPQWKHGWVPANAAAAAAVKKDPAKYAKMRAQQSSAGRSRVNLSSDAGGVIDLAGTKPGQRFRHGWIPISGGSALAKAVKGTAKMPPKKAAPRVAGSRKRGLVDGLTKEQHRARSERLVDIPRSQRTPEQHLQFARSNAVLRGQTPPTKTVLPTGPAALPARQTPGSTGGMTPSKETPADIKRMEQGMTAAGSKPALGTPERKARDTYQALAMEHTPASRREALTRMSDAELAAVANPGPMSGYDLGPAKKYRQSEDDIFAEKRRREGGLQGPTPQDGPKPDKPWSEIHKDYKSVVNGQRMVLAMGPRGTELRPHRSPPSAGQQARAAELAKGSGPRHPSVDSPSTTPPSPFERKTFKGHGIKHGDTIEVYPNSINPGAMAIKGTAHINAAGIGVHDGEKIHTLGGVATKVKARKIRDGGFERAVGKMEAKNAQPMTMAMPSIKASPTEFLAEAVRTGQVDGHTMHPNTISRMQTELAQRAQRTGSGATHPEKFAPGEKPPVHKFMNTQRLQEIANGDHPEHAAKAKAILAKRGGGKAAPTSTSGLASSNEGARAMTERILAKRAETNNQPGSSNAAYAVQVKREEDQFAEQLREQGYTIQTFPRDRLQRALDEARDAGDKMVTVKVPSGSEVTLSVAAARAILLRTPRR